MKNLILAILIAGFTVNHSKAQTDFPLPMVLVGGAVVASAVIVTGGGVVTVTIGVVDQAIENLVTIKTKITPEQIARLQEKVHKIEKGFDFSKGKLDAKEIDNILAAVEEGPVKLVLEYPNGIEDEYGAMMEYETKRFSSKTSLKNYLLSHPTSQKKTGYMSGKTRFSAPNNRIKLANEAPQSLIKNIAKKESIRTTAYRKIAGWAGGLTALVVAGTTLIPYAKSWYHEHTSKVNTSDRLMEKDPEEKNSQNKSVSKIEAQ